MFETNFPAKFPFFVKNLWFSRRVDIRFGDFSYQYKTKGAANGKIMFGNYYAVLGKNITLDLLTEKSIEDIIFSRYSDYLFYIRMVWKNILN